jgi:hypothetical protein
MNATQKQYHSSPIYILQPSSSQTVLQHVYVQAEEISNKEPFPNQAARLKEETVLCRKRSTFQAA